MTRFRLALLLPALLVLSQRAPAHAQTNNPTTGTPPAPATTPDTTRDEETGPLLSDAAAPLLDRPINRAEYRLGAGDEVSVAILGDVNRLYTVAVMPEGTVLVPTIGVARVGGLNLDEAEARVRAMVLRYYRNVEVRVGLSRVRQFKVFVVGDVQDPGVRVASAVTRVSEVVREPSPTGAIRRNVLLRRSGGDTLSVDLARFLLAGDLAQDPVLREGDVLVLPTIDETIRIHGRVSYPGTYEYRRGESLADFLTVATGGAGFPANAADTVRLSRFVSNQQREHLVMTRAEALGARGRATLLQPFDGLFVPEVSNYRVQRIATVAGLVVYPGTYPIRPDTTTVAELVAMAGGLRPEASLPEATLRREPAPDLRAQTRTAGERAAPPERAARLPQEQALQQEAALAALSRQERRVMQINNESIDTYVAIDLTVPSGSPGSGLDQRLRSGDVLTVPERRNEVTVLGAVARPGIVSFVPGQPLSHYVTVAGGFVREADRGDLTVLRPRSGARLGWRDVQAVEPGDRIIVPYREHRTVLERVQTVQGVLTTISGTVLAILAFRQLF
jgi:protein involved in polysaccharide export with SLBB domain